MIRCLALSAAGIVLGIATVTLLVSYRSSADVPADASTATSRRGATVDVARSASALRKPIDFHNRFARNAAKSPAQGEHGVFPEADATAPLKRAEYFRLQRLGNDGEIHPEALASALQHRQRMLDAYGSVAAAGIDSASWTWMGPSNVGGRVLSIVVHPTRTDEMLLGTASGGIWKSTNGGDSWRPIDDFLGSLAVATLAMDPSNPDTVYAGTGEFFGALGSIAGAGAYRSTNFGDTWMPLPQTMEPAAGGQWNFTSRLAIHPTDSRIVLAATNPGGLMRSTDGGDTWTPEGPSLWFGEVEFHPTDGNQAVAADCCDAMSRSRASQVFYYDASGPAWRPATFSAPLASTTLRAIDECEEGSGVINRVTVDSTADFRENDPVFLGTSGPVSITKIVDDTRMCINVGMSPTFPLGVSITILVYGRPELAYARSNPAIVYLVVPAAGGSLWRSDDGGQSYAPVAKRLGYMWGAGNYNNAIWVDPTDEDHVVLGGGDMIATEDGGMNFRSIGKGGHADRHWLVEHPDFDGATNKTLFIGSDGGIEVGDDVRALGAEDGPVLRAIKNGLGVTQFIHADVNTATGQILGGSQDNGTVWFRPSEGTGGWTHFAGGDGGYSWIDRSDPSWFYSEYVHGRVFRGHPDIRSRTYIHAANVDRNGQCCATDELDSGSNCVEVGAPPAGALADACTNDALFYAPTMLDPNQSLRLLVGGKKLWRTNNARAEAVTWGAVKDRIGNCNSRSDNPGDVCNDDADCPNGACAWATVSTLDIAPDDSAIVWLGYTNGMLFKTTNGTAASPAWMRVDDTAPASAPLPKRFVTRVRIDPNDTDRVYVSFGGNETDTVWQTPDAGATWRMISGSTTCDPAARPATALPCIQVNSIQVHPNQPGWLYAATDLGIYASENDGVSWSASNDGPANVLVFDLTWNDDDQLFAVTHGRGIFRTAPIRPDCNNNGINDRSELALNDCNGNRRLDVCDTASGESEDCNANGTPDECEISTASSAPGGPFFCVLDCRPDCDDNGVPDECDPDCNSNGQPDACDLGSALTFVRSTSTSAGLAPSDLARADFNDDGFVDLAVANWESYDISVLLSRGSDGAGNWLGFDPAVDYQTRSVPAIPWAVAAGDFDQDGDEDLGFVAESGDIFRLFSDLGVLLNDGAGNFSARGFSPIVVDNVGNFRSEALAVGDLNGDGFPEIVVGSTRGPTGLGDNELTLIFNYGRNASGDWIGFASPRGADRFPTVGLAPRALALGHFNGDGFLDIASANEASGDVSVLINDGTGVFGPHTPYAVGGAPSDIGAADLNDDGFDDLAVAIQTSGQVQVLFANGDGTFAPPVPINTGLPNAEVLTLEDFDRESSSDIAAADSGFLRPAVVLNSGTGVFGLPFPVEVSVPAASIVGLDVDGDADVDIATVGGGTTSRVIVVLNDTDIDCNRNGVPDHCEIDGGRGDSDGDGLLDDCERGRCDADGDGDCDLTDWRRMYECWRGPDVPCGAVAAGSGIPDDMDGDFDFDLRDYALFQLGYTAPRDCCLTHGPGCYDYAVEQCVCAVRPSCCAEAWDETCVALVDREGCGDCAGVVGCGNGACDATETCASCPRDCGACTGDCCAANETVGCQDTSTQNCACLIDTRCCSDAWGEDCAAIAADQCAACCGDGICQAGEGCQFCPTDCTDCPPACGNGFCQPGEDCINCPADCSDCPDFCGDGLCGETETCATCPQECGACEGSCCAAHATPGCDNVDIQLCVCGFAPECCEIAWDEACVQNTGQCGAQCCTDLKPSVFAAPAELVAGQDITNEVFAEVENIGSVDAGSFFVGFYLSSDAVITTGDVLLSGGRASVLSLAAGASTSVETGMTIPGDYPPGPAYLGMLVDEFDAVAGECDESNNAVAIPVTIKATVCGDHRCDPTESCITCLDDCGSCAGSCCTAHATPGCEHDIYQNCVCSFMPECCEVAWDAKCVASVGQCGVCCPDPRPNVFVAPATIDPGQDLTGLVTAQVFNSGSADAGSFFVGFYLSADATITTGDRLLLGGRDSVPGLEAGTVIWLPADMSVPGDYPPGPAYLGMLVDEFNAVPGECNENNNAISVPVTVTGAVCGDQTCDATETCVTCPGDCGGCQGDCCEANGTPGCQDAQIQGCVCQSNASCCDVSWSQTCVDQVDSLGCGTCQVDLPPDVAITDPPQDTGTGNNDYWYDGYDNALGLWYKDVTLKGEALDPDDGFLTGASLVWKTDRTDIQPGGNGSLGTGETITVRLYSNNCFGVWHEITLTAKDSAGHSVSVTRRIFIWTLC